MDRITKLTEELEKIKIEAKNNKLTTTEDRADTTKLTDRLLQENKKLDRQRGELLQAFRKQLRLVEILKRQRVHLEAAQM